MNAKLLGRLVLLIVGFLAVLIGQQKVKDMDNEGTFVQTLLGVDHSGPYNWCETGHSALVYKAESLNLEITKNLKETASLCEVLVDFVADTESISMTKKAILVSGDSNSLEIFVTDTGKIYYQHGKKLFFSKDLDQQLDRIIDIKSQQL